MRLNSVYNCMNIVYLQSKTATQIHLEQIKEAEEEVYLQSTRSQSTVSQTAEHIQQHQIAHLISH